MQVVRTGSGPVHCAPLPSGPQAEVLLAGAGADQLAAAHVVLPPGGSVPEHTHGDSAALLVPLTGELLLVGGDQQEKLVPGVVALLGFRERVRLENRTDQPAGLVAVFAPPTFIRVLSGWPTR